MPVAFDEILTAFEIRSGEPDSSVYINRETGKVLWQSDYSEELEDTPDDLEDGTQYVALPDPRDLDLGTRLVMRFAREEFADHYDEVADIFSRRGAYRRFKDLLAREGALDKWYEFEEAAKEQALREWCAQKGLKVEG